MIKTRINGIPVVGGDYQTFDKTAIIVLIDRSTSMIFSYVVPHKRVNMHWYADEVVRRDLDSLGYRRIVLKSDQERAIKALMKSVRNGCAAEILIENSTCESFIW